MKAGGRLVWKQEPERSAEEEWGKKDKPPRQRAAEETVLRDSQVPIRARRKKEQPEKLLRLLERIVLMTNQEFRKLQ